uniref:Zinc ribbon domain-containing protein n=1 Tax=Desulfobacca acetoxidans TaxID=60893 RepID=A0A7V4G781_9BACT
MPTYEFQCSQCGEVFTRIMSISEFSRGGITCPKCSSGEVKQQMTTFTAKTSRKS